MVEIECRVNVVRLVDVQLAAVKRVTVGGNLDQVPGAKRMHRLGIIAQAQDLRRPRRVAIAQIVAVIERHVPVALRHVASCAAPVARLHRLEDDLPLRAQLVLRPPRRSRE